MKNEDKQVILNVSKELHTLVETSYLNNKAVKGDDNWLEKQRLLLADMALHLLQTSINPNPINIEHLKNNLNAILTISDQFMPEIGLKKFTDKLYEHV
ncbi:hypothetical protein [Winogradskyella sp. SYSU M77433]|uniref:hypothetical protein n=1 Tax=Winogradskyella sp. SYSU M77433 TaxID=3042722 RepID=UPI00247FFA17|nr:hypothetical protein [Winogradskyella sp. SYSU M77433]MDH7911270.1 hypothetical protein [Winogradskyella sp. SYSU M77433]